MPGVKEQIETFRVSYKNISEEYIRATLEKYEKKKAEIADFDRAVKDVRQKDDLESTQRIDVFNKAKKSAADRITHPNATLTQADCVRMVKALQDELDEVRSVLLCRINGLLQTSCVVYSQS
jgi:hypothetical protein